MDNEVIETRFIIPSGADWAVWDDANGVLSFMTDAEVVTNARANAFALQGDEPDPVPRLPDDPTPEQAWEFVNQLWSGDPGGRGWQARAPAGATWLLLRDDEDDPGRGPGPELAFGFGTPPVSEGTWQAPGC